MTDTVDISENLGGDTLSMGSGPAVVAEPGVGPEAAAVRRQGGGGQRDVGPAAARGDLLPERCHLYLQRKQRYCRTIPPDGQIYCVEHSHMIPDETSRKRVPCPLDPKHTCYEDTLKKHLKKCNARPDIQPCYYVQNLNSGEIEDWDGTKVTVNTVEPEEINLMVTKVHKLYQEKVRDIRTEVMSHEALKEELLKPQNGPAAQKHLKQQASLVGHINKLGLLHDNCCYIEFGAGKAGLSHWVQRAQETCDDTKFILVDKSSVRYKMDVYHRGLDQGPDFERLRIDIEHLDPNRVPSLTDNQRPIVGLGKHLCGGATDLMLRCLMQTVGAKDPEASRNNPYVEGIVLALCCHHRCDWKSYVAKATMREWGVGPREFNLFTSMTSWATCATRTFLKKLKEREEDISSQNDQPGDDEPNYSASSEESYHHPRYGTMTPEEREEVGFKCKKLIDMGRVHYLRENGFSAQLVAYTDLSLTLENVVLLATNQKDKTTPASDASR